jgi:hypothetical protein
MSILHGKTHLFVRPICVNHDISLSKKTKKNRRLEPLSIIRVITVVGSAKPASQYQFFYPKFFVRLSTGVSREAKKKQNEVYAKKLKRSFSEKFNQNISDYKSKSKKNH